MPLIFQIAVGEITATKAFGDDYYTVDRTGVRGYIRIVDQSACRVKATTIINLDTSNS